MNQNARDNEAIRRLLATYDARRQRSSLIQYRQMHGKNAYQAFAGTLSGPLRTIANDVGAAMQGAKNATPARFRPGNILGALQRGNAKLKTMTNARQAQRERRGQLERGPGAYTASRVRANRVVVKGDGNCLFYAVAQALRKRRTGSVWPFNSPELFNVAMKMRRQIRDLQCRRHADFFGEFLENGHCQNILKPSTYGGEPDILALAIVFQTPILIFKATGDPAIFERHIPYVYGLKARSPPIFLVYTPGRAPNPELSAHYDMLDNVTVDRSALLPNVQWVPAPEDVVRFTKRLPRPNRAQPNRPTNSRPLAVNGGGNANVIGDANVGVADVSSSGGFGFSLPQLQLPSSSFWTEAAIGLAMALSCVSSVTRLAR